MKARPYTVGTLTSDVTQNSYPIYLVDDHTPTAPVVIENYLLVLPKIRHQRGWRAPRRGLQSDDPQPPNPSGHTIALAELDDLSSFTHSTNHP